MIQSMYGTRGQEWLQNNKVEILEWPSQSPDLNPSKTCGLHVRDVFVQDYQQIRIIYINILEKSGSLTAVTHVNAYATK